MFNNKIPQTTSVMVNGVFSIDTTWQRFPPPKLSHELAHETAKIKKQFYRYFFPPSRLYDVRNILSIIWSHESYLRQPSSALSATSSVQSIRSMLALGTLPPALSDFWTPQRTVVTRSVVDYDADFCSLFRELLFDVSAWQCCRLTDSSGTSTSSLIMTGVQREW